MEIANYQPKILPLLVEQNVFGEEPFFLVDIGCSGGLDPLWRLFGEQLHAVGFDPQQTECARLRAKEDNANVRYEACAVGLPDEHDFILRRQQQGGDIDRYYDPLPRSSAAALWNRGVQSQSNVIGEELTSRKVTLSDWVSQHAIRNIDFIKIDTDGFDLEAAISSEPVIRSRGVLGFMIETPFTGSHHDTANSFHNIDRFMRDQGFMIYQMTINRYSRAALPAQFVYRIPAQTVLGQPQWGDIVYLRDGAADDYEEIWGAELPVTKVLKLAALYELFQVPDCAAELLLRHASRIAPIVDPELLLDRLTPPLAGQKLSYREYVKVFEAHPERFYPALLPLRAPKWYFSRLLRRVGVR